MTLSDTEREQSALAKLEIAASWREKGNPRRELSTLSSAIVSLLGVAVARFKTSGDGIVYLHSRNTGALLSRVAELNGQLYQTLIQSDAPPSAAVDNDITPVHIAWLVQEWDAATRILHICTDPTVAKLFPLTKFWAEYHRAMASLASNQPYEPTLPKTTGYEKCWIPYLSLIADLTHHRDTSASRDEIARVFDRRNRDKRLTDWKMIDGDGKHPVQWDFRETSILHFAERSRQITS